MDDTKRPSPSDEQEIIVASTLNRQPNQPIVVQAGAGTGKTFTLKEVAQEVSKVGDRILYLVFATRNRDEARIKFRGIADVHTINGFAYQQMGVGKLDRRMGAMYPKQISQLLGLNHKICDLHSYRFSQIVKSTVDNFCMSGDGRIQRHHAEGAIAQGNNKELEGFVLEYAQTLYDRLKPGSNTQFPLGHDLYLKEWCLSGCPGLDAYDLVVVDESQDSNGVSISAFRRAQSLLLVGDQHQSIYGFRNAVSAMTSFGNTKEHTLSQSFRFGTPIADLANAVVRQKQGGQHFTPLKGLHSIPSSIGKIRPGDPQCRLYRSNVELMLDALFLMDRGLDIQILGDMSDLRDKLFTAWQLYLGNNITGKKHPLISQYKDWGALEKVADSGADVELSIVCNVITEYKNRIEDLIDMLSKKWISKNPKVTLVTGHRSKGLEFNNVVVCSDFDKSLKAAKRNGCEDEELNLLYVATTRARHILQPDSSFLSILAYRNGLLK